MRLPDFLIIGTAKAGTTAATINLRRHADIDMLPRHKPDDGAMELHFFAREVEWHKGVAWYASHFDSAKRIVGGKSINYLAEEKAHARMRAVVRNTKLIAMLREPVARAYSQWNFFNQRIRIQEMAEWSVETFERVMGIDPSSPPLWYHQQVLTYGHYSRQLRHLFKFFPREQVYVAICERVKANMAAEYAKMFDFLGTAAVNIDPSGYREDNSYSYPKAIDPATEAKLREYYRPHNEDLFELIGEVPEWA